MFGAKMTKAVFLQKTEDMTEIIPFQFPVPDKMQNIIRVIGVGGGGCNVFY